MYIQRYDLSSIRYYYIHTHTHHTHRHIISVINGNTVQTIVILTYGASCSYLTFPACTFQVCALQHYRLLKHTRIYMKYWMQTDQSDSFDQPINPPPNSYNSAGGTRLACVSYTGTGNHKYSFRTTYMPTASYNSYDYCCLSHANIAICMIGTDRCFYIYRIVYRRNSDRKIYECRHLTTQWTGWTK